MFLKLPQPLFFFLVTLSLCGCIEFCYKGEECGPSSDLWPGQCKTGHHQSPIDLRSNSNPKKAILDFNDGYKSNEFWIRNNGHSIQVNLDSESTSNGKMSGYGFDRPYIFAQIHFHWGEDNLSGSEHTLNDKHFPLEVHLVHYDSKYKSFAEAESSGDEKGLAVLGLFLSVGQESDENSAFSIISSKLPLEYQEEVEHFQVPLDLHSFLPLEEASFFRYLGSLTTPNCTEAVEWTVIREPILVKPSEIEKFHRIHDHSGDLLGLNCRPVQGLGDRLLEYLVKSDTTDDMENSSQNLIIFLPLLYFLSFIPIFCFF